MRGKPWLHTAAVDERERHEAPLGRHLGVRAGAPNMAARSDCAGADAMRERALDQPLGCLLRDDLTESPVTVHDECRSAVVHYFGLRVGHDRALADVANVLRNADQAV